MRKCYSVVNDDNVNAISVNKGRLNIAECEACDSVEAIIENLLQRCVIRIESHWRCDAQSDNGIDADEVKDVVNKNIDFEQIVLDEDKIVGVYLEEHNAVVMLGKCLIVNKVEEGYVGGWGEVSTYEEIRITECTSSK